MKYADQSGEYFALPGGGQLHGETLPETLARECHEELGISVGNRGLRFVREYIGDQGESSWRDTGVHQVEFLFECEIDAGHDSIDGTHRDHTQVDVSWLPIDHIGEYRFYPKKLAEYLGSPLADAIEYWGSAE